MKQHEAFAGSGRMLKGALHCHTTRSDGKVEPGDALRLYSELGYDFAALTDHRIYNFVNYAPQTPITVIPGMEFDNTFERDHGFRTFHTVCIGPSEADGNGYRHDQRLASGTAKDQSEYQAYLDEIHEKKNLTIYCHPEWSSTPARYFDRMQGNFAMEIWNTGCVMECDMDSDAAYWDELLGQGQRIWGVATDDGHKAEQFGGGWVMVRAENNVNSILDALKAGRFYSSCGPEIYNFYVEDNKAVVECSPAARVRFHSDMHPTRIRRAGDGTISRAEFNLCDKNGNVDYRYIRAVVVDSEGRKAWTNPIFLD